MSRTLRPSLCLAMLVSLGALLSAGCAKKEQVDPVTKEMQAAVADSAARPYVTGRQDWEVKPEREEYWIEVKIVNQGRKGEVALRGAIKTMTPYVGIGEAPTEPIYFEMKRHEEVRKILRGKIAQRPAERAIGCAIEIYPKYTPEEE